MGYHFNNIYFMIVFSYRVVCEFWGRHTQWWCSYMCCCKHQMASLNKWCTTSLACYIFMYMLFPHCLQKQQVHHTYHICKVFFHLGLRKWYVTSITFKWFHLCLVACQMINCNKRCTTIITQSILSPVWVCLWCFN